MESGFRGVGVGVGGAGVLVAERAVGGAIMVADGKLAGTRVGSRASMANWG